MEEDKGIENQKLTNIIGLIFLPILFLTVIGDYFISNSDEYITRKYEEFNKYSFEGEIFDKTEDQKGGGANVARYIHLKTGIIHRVDISKYYDLSIGDYVIKKSKSDTVLYIRKSHNDTLKFIENNYLKEYQQVKAKNK